MSDQTTTETDPAPVQQGRCEGSSTSALFSLLSLPDNGPHNDKILP